jgi:hypothetical protein
MTQQVRVSSAFFLKSNQVERGKKTSAFQRIHNDTVNDNRRAINSLASLIVSVRKAEYPRLGNALDAATETEYEYTLAP